MASATAADGGDDDGGGTQVVTATAGVPTSPPTGADGIPAENLVVATVTASSRGERGANPPVLSSGGLVVAGFTLALYRLLI